MTNPTPYQLLGQVRDMFGCAPHLYPYDEVVSVAFFDDHAVVVLRHHKLTERATEDILSGRTIQMWKCSRESFYPVLGLSCPDPDFVPVRHKRFDYKTPEERRAKRHWEASCGRPGRGKYGAPIQAQREADYFASDTNDHRTL